MRITQTILSFAIMSVLTGCSQTQLENDIKRVQASVNDLRSFQAEQTSKLSTLESEVRSLSGRLEELEYAQNKRLGGDLTDLKRDLTELKKRIPPPVIVPAILLENDEANLEALPAELSTLVAESFAALREGKFDVAEERLMNATSIARGSEWNGDVLFWLGVARDGLDKNREALQAYHQLIAEFSRHRKSAPALLRQSSVFVKLGDTKVARLTLNKLIAEFPKSEEAKRAKERLKDL
jgi:TolA-binding protein